MKKIVIIVFTLFSLITGLSANAQTTTPDLTKNAKPAKDTTVKNITYTIWVGTKGGRFIIVKSKTGSLYKKYLPKG